MSVRRGATLDPVARELSAAIRVKQLTMHAKPELSRAQRDCEARARCTQKKEDERCTGTTLRTHGTPSQLWRLLAICSDGATGRG